MKLKSEYLALSKSAFFESLVLFVDLSLCWSLFLLLCQKIWEKNLREDALGSQFQSSQSMVACSLAVVARSPLHSDKEAKNKIQEEARAEIVFKNISQ